MESVVDKRRRKGRDEYFVKWLGYEDADNTWEPLKNFDNTILIDEFERKKLNTDFAAEAKRVKKEVKSEAKVETSVNGTPKREAKRSANFVKEETKQETKRRVKLEVVSEVKAEMKANGKSPKREAKRSVSAVKPVGFALGLTAGKVLDVTRVDGQILYSVEWSESNAVDLVPESLAKERCPLLVIDFLQTRT